MKPAHNPSSSVRPSKSFVYIFIYSTSNPTKRHFDICLFSRSLNSCKRYQSTSEAKKMSTGLSKVVVTKTRFQRICRACLELIRDQKYVDLEDPLVVGSESEEPTDINEWSEAENISVLHAFNECTQLQVRLSEDDFVEDDMDLRPAKRELESCRYLCCECSVELKKAYQFIIKSRLSNEALLEQLRQQHIKIEKEQNANASDEGIKNESINDGDNEMEEEDVGEIEYLTDDDREQLELIDPPDEEIVGEQQKITSSSSSTSTQQIEEALVAIFGTDICEAQTTKHNLSTHEQHITIERKNEIEDECEDDEDATSVEVRLVKSDADDQEEDEAEERQHTLQFKCELCTMIYDMQRELVLHYEQDHDQRDFHFSCNFCEHRFFSKSALNVHTRQIHQNCEFIDCSHCGRTVLKSFFKMHLRRHTQQKKFLCFECPSTFTSKYTLKKHLLTHAKDRNRNIACDVCGRKFYTIESFKTHQIIHQDPKDRETYSCSLCEKTFMRQTNLKLHMQMHRGDTIDCPHCGKKFVRRKDLEIHIRFHTGNFPFACSSCDKRFAIKSHLNAHERKHKGIKYQCQWCNKQFINVAGLRQHAFEHTGMPLCCGVCERGFPTKFKVRRHLRSVHHNLFPLGYKDDEAEKYIKELTKEMSKNRKCTKTKVVEVVTKTEAAEDEENYEMLEMLDDNEDDLVTYLASEI